MTEIVNISPLATELERLLVGRLGELLGSVPWLSGWTVRHLPAGDGGWDGEARIPFSTGEHAQLFVECKRELRPAEFEALAGRRRVPVEAQSLAVAVLAVGHLTERLVEVCRRHGWSCYDLAGNCRLEIPGRLYIERKGNAPVYRPTRPVASLDSPEAARVMRALLAPEHAGRGWTQRELQAGCQPEVSLGLVNKLVRRLRDETYLEEVRERGFRVRDPEGALGQWAAAYRFDSHSRHGYFTLLQGRKLAEALAQLPSSVGERAVYASFSAADLQAPHVRQPRTWLYLSPDAEAAFCEALAAKPVESGENLIVLFPADAGVFCLPDRAPGRLAATNLVQTYVDLRHSGGRGSEAAEALLEQRLRPAWRAGAPR